MTLLDFIEECHERYRISHGIFVTRVSWGMTHGNMRYTPLGTLGLPILKLDDQLFCKQDGIAYYRSPYAIFTIDVGSELLENFVKYKDAIDKIIYAGKYLSIHFNDPKPMILNIDIEDTTKRDNQIFVLLSKSDNYIRNLGYIESYAFDPAERK